MVGAMGAMSTVSTNFALDREVATGLHHLGSL
jgi:hypothetical protein